MPQFLQLLHALDRDNGLAREVLEQLDLPIGEWPRLLSIDDDCADDLSLPEDRYGEEAARADRFDEGHHRRGTLDIAGVLGQIGNMLRRFSAGNPSKRN